MSQVTFRTKLGEKSIEVMAGWDRPMGEFFLTVFGPPRTEDEDEEIIWSAINNPSPVDRQGTLRLRTKLVELGITAPEGFWEKVEAREGNVRHAFHNGRWVS